ncbi:MAG: arginine repressor [Clostridia bacterium]|nr:arginine repressor [Clostridia bacterium]
MSRANRQIRILDIISKHDIDTQEELVTYLKAEGFNVTQATVSRDIKEMNIIKTLAGDGKHYKYVARETKETSTSDKFLNIFKSTVLSIRAAENLVVLRTEAGSAGPASELIDRLKYEEVLGVIAGDNTIFVAVDTLEHTQLVKQRLEDLLDTTRLR